SAAKLHHTNIVPVFGVGEQDGLHYYVMQFIPGLGLDVVLDELRRLRLPAGAPVLTLGGAAPRPSDFTQDISPVHSARALLSGEFRRSGPENAPTTDRAWPAAEPKERELPVATASSRVGNSSSVTSATIHLPGQSEGSTLNESGRQYWQSVARIGMQVA